MKKFAIFALMAALAFCFAGVANADTCPAGSTNCLQGGGVTYTFTNLESDGGGVFDVSMVVSGPLPGFGLTSFSVFFTSGSDKDTNVSLESAPGGTAQWTALQGQQNTGNGVCSNATSTPFTCFVGGTVADGTYVFDVTISGTPDGVDLKIGQSTDFSISDTTGVGGSTPPPTPEPASMLLLGLGLAGVPFLRRKK